MTVDLIERAQEVRREMFPPGQRDLQVLEYVCFMLGMDHGDAEELQRFMNQELAGAEHETQRIARALVLGIELGIASERAVREAIE